MNILSNQPIRVDFKPERIERTATFTINEKIENVFPLFGPIREMEWADGWNPEIIYRSHDQVLVEEHMIFQTNGQLDEGKYTWVITTFQPKNYLIEYTVSTVERIWFIKAHCASAGDKTQVNVTYSYTGLTDLGNQRNAKALKRMFADDLKDWEAAINYYLKTGKVLTSN